MSNSKLWWASVGGNPCEPIQVVEENGKQVFYSIGCADAHEMIGVVLVHETSPPKSPVETEQEKKRLDELFKKERAKRGYRQFT